MLQILVAIAVICVCVGATAVPEEEKPRLSFKKDGTFKMLHLSDVHYRIGPDQPCRDITKAQEPYCQEGHKNTTDFISRLIALEQPDLVVHTGDIIDGGTHTAAQGMEDLYGVSYGAGIPWAATIGNHDCQSDLDRPSLMNYILGLPKTVSELNALGEGETESYGNFYLEIFEDAQATTPSFRTFHLDANTNNVSINAAQVDWFSQTAASLTSASAAPALAFFHIPLEEYKYAGRDGDVCGSFKETVSYNGQSGLFDALLQEGSVKATFAGHDHTNDFCADYKGVQLCYEGSPGYQSYMRCTTKEHCLNRKARVTEISGFGKQVRSWKREALDYPETQVIDVETLWAADEVIGSDRVQDGDCVRQSSGMADDVAYSALYSNRKAHYEMLEKEGQ